MRGTPQCRDRNGCPMKINEAFCAVLLLDIIKTSATSRLINLLWTSMYEYFLTSTFMSRLFALCKPAPGCVFCEGLKKMEVCYIALYGWIHLLIRKSLTICKFGSIPNDHSTYQDAIWSGPYLLWMIGRKFRHNFTIKFQLHNLSPLLGNQLGQISVDFKLKI